MPDLQALFELDENALELIIRASVLYLSLLVVFRVLGRRESGGLELPELLLLVLIADGVQNGMAGAYTSVSGALIVAATLFGWNYALDALAYYSPAARRLIVPAPLAVVRDGAIVRPALRREMISLEELKSMLREKDVERIDDVAIAYLERNGELTVKRRRPS